MDDPIKVPQAAREDVVIDIINAVTDLAEVGALDKAYPEIWDRLDAFERAIRADQRCALHL